MSVALQFDIPKPNTKAKRVETKMNSSNEEKEDIVLKLKHQITLFRSAFPLLSLWFCLQMNLRDFFLKKFHNAEKTERGGTL